MMDRPFCLNYSSYSSSSSKGKSLTVGGRVEFLSGAFPDDKSPSKHSTPLDPSLRQGVVVSLFQRIEGYNGIYAIFALDLPLNEVTSSIQRRAGNMFGIPGDGHQTLAIRSEMLRSYPVDVLSIEKQKKFMSPSPLHLCRHCMLVKNRNIMIEIPTFGTVCFEHLFPLNESLAAPDVLNEDVKDMVAYFQSLDQTMDVINTTAEPYGYPLTRALVHSKMWHKCKSDEEKEKYFFSNVMQDTFSFSDSRGNLWTMKISDLDSQLFPKGLSRKVTYEDWIGIRRVLQPSLQLPPPPPSSSSDNSINTSNRIKNEQKPKDKFSSMPKRLLSELRKYNVNDSDIELLLKNGEEYELNSMDMETALACILSTKDSNPTKHSQTNNTTIVTYEPTQRSSDTSKLISRASFSSVKVHMLRKSMTVVFEFPMLKSVKRFELHQGMSLQDIIKLITVGLPDLGRGNEVLLYHISDKRRIVSLLSGSQRNPSMFCTVDSIENESHIEVRNSLDNVGLKSKIETLTAEYVAVSIVEKFQNLGLLYNCWRSVRGDGNCYYRAVIFSVIENIILSKQLHLFGKLLTKFRSLVDLDHEYIKSRHRIIDSDMSYTTIDGSVYLSIDNLCDMLQFASAGAVWSTVEEFESDILDVSKGIDLVFIRACRQLVVEYLIGHSEMELNGLPLKDAILPSYPDVSDIGSYCDKYVTTMGEDAEGPLVLLGVLPLSLGCSVVTIAVDRRDDVNTNVFEIQCPDDNGNMIMESNTPLTIHLLLRPGHYDVLYPRFDLFQTQGEFCAKDVLNQRCCNPIKDVKRLTNQQEVPDMLIFPPKESIYPIHSICNIRRVIIKTDYQEIVMRSGLWIQNSKSNSKSLDKFYVCVSSTEELFDQLVEELSVGKERIQHLTYGNRSIKQNESLSKIQNDECLTPVIEGLCYCALLVHSDSPNAITYTAYIDQKLIENISTFTYLANQQINVHPHSRLYRGNELLKDIHSIQSGDLLQISESIDVKVIRPCDVNVSISASASTSVSATVNSNNIDGKSIMVTIDFQDSIGEIMNKIKFSVGFNQNRNVMIDIVHQNLPSKRLQYFTLVSDLHSMLLKGYYFRINYCDCIKSCNNQIKDSIHVSDGCSHVLCTDCLSRAIDNLPTRTSLIMNTNSNNNTIKAFSTASASASFEEEYLRVNSIFATPDVKDLSDTMNYMPKLREILCPVSGCGTKLTEKTLATTEYYQTNLMFCLEEIDIYKQSLRTWKPCGLKDELCGETSSPLHHLIQLGCEHFFHFDCIIPYIRNDIDRSKQIISKKGRITEMFFNCPVCLKEKRNICLCEYCRGSRFHTLTQNEADYLHEMKPTEFTKDNLDQFIEISAKLAIKTNENEDLVFCNGRGCHEAHVVPRTETVLYCRTCNASTCINCQSDAHPEMTCEEAARQCEINTITQSGLLLQCCPGCMTTGAAPIDCLHITCRNQNCGQQFCFLCAASYTPIPAHSNAYHRRGCDFYSNLCCEKKCITDGKKPVCELEKFKPGPCKRCKSANNHNNCTHVKEWKPCSSCSTRGVICHHWCLECEKVGSLCKPPGDIPANMKILSHEAVKAECSRLQESKKQK